ncbi:MAG: T9SS type A sorting domain-containing protein [Crocinitomicaceae bacterium]|nr:T9SS type A sorting domain-containing protein [Crocinitomicaceae bacterium]MBK8924856.1 T9SS type A sorting domain-containing protein [Crocinitomicaceae bacterium]
MRYLQVIYLLFLVLNINQTGNAQDTCLTNLSIGISFPPVSDDTQRNFTKAHLDFLNITKIRFDESWELREPTQGIFNWQPLDDRINWANENGYEILLTIQSNGPAWACSAVQNGQSCVFNDNSFFQIYVDSLLKRYPNQIDKIQFGNEWQSDYWYAGNANDFIEANNIVYNSVQIYSPQTEVVLGGFSTIALRFLAGCNGYVSSFYDDDGNLYDDVYLTANCSSPEIVAAKNRIDSILTYAYYDMLDIHLYDDVEQWDEYYLNFTDTITKPVIVSEFGGPNVNIEPYSEAYQTDRLYLYIHKLDSLNISEAYYFKLVEGTANAAHVVSGLIDDTTLTEKMAYYLLKSFLSCTAFTYTFQYDNNIRFYPNPMGEYSVMEFNNDSPSEMKTITIHGADGKLVKKIECIIPGQYYILNREDMNAGVYYVVISETNQIIAEGKLVIK